MMKSHLRMAIASLILLLGTVSAFAQQQISGTVKDQAGEPIIGASVVVPGTTNGVITDVNGAFSIRVAPGTNLEISCIGYVTQRVTAAPNLAITLQDDSLLLEEAVAVGYGSITKRSVSTAISTVKGNKIAEMPNSTMAQSLAGMSSGITLQQVNGEPGAAPAIRIRGNGSVNSGNDPLYVIDGYPTTDAQLFNNLNPIDIEDIQIMKDAASSAIYGSKAGNGVIIITTKQGREGKPKVNFSTQVGISQAQNFVDVLNADDFLDMIIEARTNSGTIGQFQNLVDLRKSGNYPNTNWQDEVFRNALNARANLSVTGGSERVRYNFSVGYQNEDGILLNSFFKKVTVKGGFEAKLTDWLKFGASFSPTYSYRRSQSPSGGNTEDHTGVIAEVLTGAPILPVYQPNGDYTQTQQHYPTYGLNNQWRNPVANLLENNDDTFTIRTVNSAFIEATPLKGLTLRSTLNFSTNSVRREYYQSAYMLGGAYTGNKSTPYLNVIDAYRRSDFGYNLYWSTTATYKWDIADLHHFNAVAGYDYEYNSGFWVRQDDRTDADNPVAYNNTTITNVNGATLWNGSSSFSEYLFDAIFGRLIYDYDNKYILSASVRRDRSSKFGPDNRAGIFWSVSGAWNLSEEAFLKDVSWLNIAKIRASYGVTGNDQIGNNYAWISELNKNHDVVFGTTAVKGYYPSAYSNRMLGWEKNNQVDLGFDLGVIDRINLTVDLYRRVSDIVMPASIPNFNGIASSINMNSGQIENKGIEIQLTARPFTGDFQWETTLNWSLNRNKILSLADGQDQLSNQRAGTKWSNVIRNYVGRPMGDMYMYKVIGTFNTEADLQKARKGTQALGDLMFEDYSGPQGTPDGVINTYDMQLVGNYQPKFTYGWNNTFAYKNFDLAMTIDGQVGGNVIYAAARAFTLNRYDDNVLAESGLGRWKSPTDTGNGMSHKAGTANLGSNIDASTRYLYDASYLRIRNLSLGYTLPKRICQKIGMEGIRLSANVQNLWTFDRYPGYTVEANYNGNSATNNGVDFGGYPLNRTMTFGVNINF
ncbi:MAG: TonB-dependent receptor [Bacteroidales bacterium]|nr:TonB-dependent receptor [Bacteroidales bacterium]